MGSKKKAALHGASKSEKKTLDKKAAKALAIREAEIREELERRAKAKKKSKKSGKKSKPAKPSKKAKRSPDVEPVDVSALGVMTISAEAAFPAEPVVTDEQAAIDEQIKARLAEKRAAREAPHDDAADPTRAERRAELDVIGKTINRDDAEAVRAHNLEAVKVGAMLLTSNAERAETTKRMSKATASSNVDKGGLVAAAEAHVPTEQVAEIVETDHGKSRSRSPTRRARPASPTSSRTGTINT